MHVNDGRFVGIYPDNRTGAAGALRQTAPTYVAALVVNA